MEGGQIFILDIILLIQNADIIRIHLVCCWHRPSARTGDPSLAECGSAAVIVGWWRAIDSPSLRHVAVNIMQPDNINGMDFTKYIQLVLKVPTIDRVCAVWWCTLKEERHLKSNFRLRKIDEEKIDTSSAQTWLKLMIFHGRWCGPQDTQDRTTS